MLGECISSVLLERRRKTVAERLTPHVGATAARFYAERITQALIDGGGDVVSVTQAMLPLPPRQRRTAAVQLATAWVELAARGS